VDADASLLSFAVFSCVTDKPTEHTPGMFDQFWSPGFSNALFGRAHMVRSCRIHSSLNSSREVRSFALLEIKVFVGGKGGRLCNPTRVVKKHAAWMFPHFAGSFGSRFFALMAGTSECKHPASIPVIGQPLKDESTHMLRLL
jgi:hypothetical protein